MFDQNNNWKPSGLEPAWEDERHLLDNPEFNRVMDICMEDLPSSWKTAVLWKYRLEKEAKEICQELEITPSNYWQILHRAKLLLKECLELKWFNRS
jgi:RNA polymerase sigma-70 factor (ECF subfamily)